MASLCSIAYSVFLQIEKLDNLHPRLSGAKVFLNCRSPLVFRASPWDFLSKMKVNALVETLLSPEWSDSTQRPLRGKWVFVKLFPDLADAPCSFQVRGAAP